MRWRTHTVVDATTSGDDVAFGEEEGERMVGFEVDDRGRYESRGRVDGHMFDSQRRLSRELEEGFRDDSDEEHEDDQRTHGSTIPR